MDQNYYKLRDSDMELVELTSYYIDRYLEDMRALKVIDATIQPKATESIGAIESLF